jgi:hypothetical protein
MVSKEHIDRLIATALHGPTDNATPSGYGQHRWSAPRFGADHTELREGDGSASLLGDMLVRENLSSIHYRYPDTITSPDNTPGPIDQYWLTEYAFQVDAKPLTIAQAAKALACYKYQSCEHPGWPHSDAREFCNKLRDRLCGCLPGYDDAEWELSSEPDPEPPAPPPATVPVPHLRFLWNGIKGSDGKLQRCWYSYRNWIPGIDPETVGITAKDYERFSAEIHGAFTVENHTDLQSDYFDSDRIKVSRSHPLYSRVKAAYDAQEAHRNRHAAKRMAGAV